MTLPSTAVETATAQCTNRCAVARGHRLNTSIVLAAVPGLFRAVSAIEPSLFRPPPPPPPPPPVPSLISNLASVDVKQNGQNQSAVAYVSEFTAMSSCLTVIYTAQPLRSCVKVEVAVLGAKEMLGHFWDILYAILDHKYIIGIIQTGSSHTKRINPKSATESVLSHLCPSVCVCVAGCFVYVYYYIQIVRVWCLWV